MRSRLDIGVDDRTVNAEVAVQLCQLAEQPLERIEGELRSQLPDWDAVWIPKAPAGSTTAYVAFNGNQYVVVVSGARFPFERDGIYDWLVGDFNVFEQVAWPFADEIDVGLPLAFKPNGGDAQARGKERPMVSRGTWAGLRELLELESASGQSLLDFLMVYCVERGRPLAFTGHGLGGGLVAPAALWLRRAVLARGAEPPPDWAVVTFGAPAVGNRAFADLFDSTIAHAWRYYNHLDIVPMVTSEAIAMSALFPHPAPQATDVRLRGRVTLARAFELFEGAVLAADAISRHYAFYSHTNVTRGALAVNAERQVFDVATQDAVAAWFAQAAEQHALARYHEWLRSPSDPCGAASHPPS